MGKMVCRRQGRWIFQAGHWAGEQKCGRPRTLIRAARDYAVEKPEFALTAGMTGLRGIANGYSCEITGVDVLDAYSAVI
jgi:hypothetical protein